MDLVPGDMLVCVRTQETFRVDAPPSPTTKMDVSARKAYEMHYVRIEDMTGSVVSPVGATTPHLPRMEAK